MPMDGISDGTAGPGTVGGSRAVASADGGRDTVGASLTSLPQDAWSVRYAVHWHHESKVPIVGPDQASKRVCDSTDLRRRPSPHDRSRRRCSGAVEALGGCDEQ